VAPRIAIRLTKAGAQSANDSRLRAQSALLDRPLSIGVGPSAPSGLFRISPAAGGKLFNYGHFSEIISTIVVSVTPKTESDVARLESNGRGHSPESTVLIDVLHSAQDSGCRERTEPMAFRQKTHDLARNLVASEADASTVSLQTGPAAVRVYERLRRQLGAPVGVGGFQALASRALALAKSESPQLGAVQIAANGDLRGLGEVESHAQEGGEAGIILIAQLLGLFLTFLGEATTLRLVEDLRLQVDVRSESATIAEETTPSAVDEAARVAVFEDLLLEIDRLRSVSEHIETLADRHPEMEEGLMSVAGNLRSIATVLDVFTLIRSKAGGSQDTPNLQTNRYMN
jgi:hypothetical protein